MTDLNPCPFCGNPPVATVCSDLTDNFDHHYSIACHECGFEICDEYRSGVTENWNRRLESSAPVKGETEREAAREFVHPRIHGDMRLSVEGCRLIAVNAFCEGTKWQRGITPTTGGWRPVAEADKDAERLLLGIVRKGVLEEIHIGGYRYAYNDDDVSCWWSDQADDEICPTHWHPLPAAPSSTSGEGQ
jgi:hypothetical protein